MSAPRNAANLRRLREAAAARGDCYTCRCRPAKPGRRTCQKCLDEGRVRKTALTAKRRAEGLCWCGRQAHPWVLCERHRERVSKMTARRVARLHEAGRCQCGRPAKAGCVTCQFCIGRINAHGKARTASLNQIGLCTRCGVEPQTETSQTCAACARKFVEWKKAAAARRSA